MSADLERCECGDPAIGAVNHGGGVREPICAACLARVQVPQAPAAREAAR